MRDEAFPDTRDGEEFLTIQWKKKSGSLPAESSFWRIGKKILWGGEAAAIAWIKVSFRVGEAEP